MGAGGGRASKESRNKNETGIMPHIMYLSWRFSYRLRITGGPPARHLRSRGYRLGSGGTPRCTALEGVVACCFDGRDKSTIRVSDCSFSSGICWVAAPRPPRPPRPPRSTPRESRWRLPPDRLRKREKNFQGSFSTSPPGPRHEYGIATPSVIRGSQGTTKVAILPTRGATLIPANSARLGGHGKGRRAGCCGDCCAHGGDLYG